MKNLIYIFLLLFVFYVNNSYAEDAELIAWCAQTDGCFETVFTNIGNDISDSVSGFFSDIGDALFGSDVETFPIAEEIGYVDEGFTPADTELTGGYIETYPIPEDQGYIDQGLTPADSEVDRGLTEGFTINEEAGQGSVLMNENNVPQKAKDVLDYINEHNAPPRYYKGAQIWENNKNQLPVEGDYKEYDIDPKISGQPRNAERIVIDVNTGDAWYTPDHYETFIKMN